MIAPQILVLSAGFAILWGISLWEAITEYQAARRDRAHYPKAFVRALRQVVMAGALFLTASAYLLRTTLVLGGLGDDQAGIITFYALLASNLIGGLFCAVSLRYD